MKKQIFSFCRALFSLSLLFGIVMTSCKQEDLPIKVESVTLNVISVTMSVGDTLTLTAIISPFDAENQRVLWSTSNANVVTVKDGIIRAVTAGEATVVVKTDDGGKTAECAVVVKGANEGDGTEEGEDDEYKWPIASVLGTVTATTVQFDMTLDISSMSGYQEAGLIFSPVDDLDVAAEGVTIFQLTRENYSKVFEGLAYNTAYYYTTYLKKDGFYLYGEKAEFTTSNVLLDLSVASSTATTAQITGTVEGFSESDKSQIEVGMFYSSEAGKVEKGEGTKLTASEISSDNAFSFDLSDLMFGTKYYYCSYVKQGEGYVYGEVKEFVAGSVSVNLSAGSITATTAQITGTVEGLSESDKSQIEVGLLYSSEAGKVEKGEGTKRTASEISSDNTVSFTLSDLTFGTTYYYCSYVKQGDGYVYGEVKEFVAGSVSVNLSAGSITATSAQITGTVEGLSESDKSQIEVGMLYSSEAGKVEKGEGTKLAASEISSDNSVSFTLSELAFGTIYYYCSYVKQGGVYLYGDVLDFTSINVTLSELSVVPSSFRAEVNGIVTGLYEEDKEHIKVGVLYSSESGKVENGEGKKIVATEISADGVFSVLFSDLTIETKYYYCSYVKQGSSYTYGTPAEFTTLKHPYDIPQNLDVASATDLSAQASANCYIVSASGLYKFKAVEGNSTTSVGSVSSASILWETFGTSTTPNLFELIKGVCYKDGYIAFQTADTFKKGNAVIAAKDADGNILWSWHIWLTNQPQGQTYYNNAGTMMDRNLGATSSFEVGLLGLLYQWGRKDPFLGSSSIIRSTPATSTITWPSTVKSNSSNGTISYATAHPTTFITGNDSNGDWYYTSSSSMDNTRWTTSSEAKSIYDPCPAGWRVPDGGSNGVWSKALGSSSSFTDSSIKNGMDFSGKFGSASIIWYPSSGYRSSSDGSLYSVGGGGCYWSASPSNYYAYYLSFTDFYSNDTVDPSERSVRACGHSVRCLQE